MAVQPFVNVNETMGVRCYRCRVESLVETVYSSEMVAGIGL